MAMCAINLSGSTIGDDDFLAFLHEQFECYGVSPKLICFEMTWNMVKKKYMGNSLDLIYKIFYFGNCHKSLAKGDTSGI